MPIAEIQSSDLKWQCHLSFSPRDGFYYEMGLKWFEVGIPNLTHKDMFAFELISIKISFVKSITPKTFNENFVSSNVNSNGP